MRLQAGCLITGWMPGRLCTLSFETNVISSTPTDGTVEGPEKICWKCGKSFHTAIENCPDDGSRLLELTSEDRQDPLIGTLFDGRFRIFHKLGEGGMGAVYSARRLDFDSEVALKLLKGDFARDEGIRKRFLYEARTISNLQHPHSVRLFDFGQTAEGHFYMVMELLRGESLAERLAYRFVTYREIFEIIPPICGVLGEAHSREVIHRDLKPENIFLQQVSENQEFPKLLDFGIAKHHGIATMTQSGTLWGTPAYMSPEQARGDVIGPRADIYGIGVMLYELISGNLPFHASTQMGFAVKHINDKPRSMLTIPGLHSVPVELDDFVLNLLAKDPQQRPETMEEVATNLLSIRERFFDDALLMQTPATEVDPAGLKDWLRNENNSQDFSRSDASTPSVVRTEVQIPTLNVFPLLENEEPDVSNTRFDMLNDGKTASFFDESAEAEEQPLLKRRASRMWIGVGGLVCVAIILFAWSILSTVFRAGVGELANNQPMVTGSLSEDYEGVMKMANQTANSIIAGAREVVREKQFQRSESDFVASDEPYLLIVDEPLADSQDSTVEMSDADKKKSVKPAVKKKRRTLKEALEGTF